MCPFLVLKLETGSCKVKSSEIAVGIGDKDLFLASFVSSEVEAYIEGLSFLEN